MQRASAAFPGGDASESPETLISLSRRDGPRIYQRDMRALRRCRRGV